VRTSAERSSNCNYGRLMFTTARFRSLGILTALGAALLVFFIGTRLVSRGNRGSGAAPAPAVEQNDLHEAKMLEEELKKKPQHAPVLFRMAQLSEQAGDNAKAAEHLREVLRQEPNNQDARLELGKVLYQLGDVEGALEHTRAILKASPEHPDALYNLGAIYGNLGDGKLAREHWNRLIAASPQSQSGLRARSMLKQIPAESQTSRVQDLSRTTKEISSQ